MSQEALIEQAKQKFLEEIDEIVNIEGVEDDEAFSRWICRNFLRIDDESDEEDAVEVGGALIIGPEETTCSADEAGVFLVGVKGD